MGNKEIKFNEQLYSQTPGVMVGHLEVLKFIIAGEPIGPDLIEFMRKNKEKFSHTIDSAENWNNIANQGEKMIKLLQLPLTKMAMQSISLDTCPRLAELELWDTKIALISQNYLISSLL